MGEATPKIVAKTSADELRHLFIIRALQPVTVTLRAGPLVGPNRKDVEVKLLIDGKPYSGAPLSLSPAAPAQAELNGTFPLTGKYWGYLEFVAGEKKDPRLIEVTREASEATATVANLNTVAFSWPCGEQTFRFSIKETPGRQSSEYNPVLVSIAHNRSATQKIQARFDKANIEKISSNPATFLATIEGLSPAGEYTGTLQVKASDSLPFEHTFTILVKHSWCLAVFMIIIGVAISWWLRWWMKKRPALVAKARASELLATVDEIFDETSADRTATETEVLQMLESQLNTVLAQIDKGEPRDFTDAISDLEARISLAPGWITARRQVDAIQPTALQETGRATLRKVLATLRKEPATKDEIVDARAALAKLPIEITDLIKGELKKNVTAFRTEIEEEKNRRMESGFTLAVNRDVVSHLASTDDALAREHIELARQEFEKARVGYAHVLVDSLSDSIKAIAARPEGFDTDADWQRVQREVGEGLTSARSRATADEIMAEYNARYGAYLQKLAEAMNRAASQWGGQLSDDERKEMADAQEKVQARIREGDLGEARKVYADALAAYQEMTKKLRGGAAMGGYPALVGSVASAPSSGALPPTAGLGETERVRVRLRETAREIHERIKASDLFVNVIVLLATVAIGFKFLWMDNATWGSLADYFVALFWGLGLHGFTFQGVEGLRDKLTK